MDELKGLPRLTSMDIEKAKQETLRVLEHRAGGEQVLSLAQREAAFKRRQRAKWLACELYGQQTE